MHSLSRLNRRHPGHRWPEGAAARDAVQRRRGPGLRRRRDRAGHTRLEAHRWPDRRRRASRCERSPQCGNHRHGRRVLSTIGLVVDGQPIVADLSVIDQYTYRLPHLDVRTTACGGGTIARRDPQTGALRVRLPGQRGSRARPRLLRARRRPGHGHRRRRRARAAAPRSTSWPDACRWTRPVSSTRPSSAAGRLPGPGARGDRGRPDQRQQPARRDPDPSADPGTRPRPARLRPVLLRRRGARPRVRLRGRDRRTGGADPAGQRGVNAVGLRHRGRRRWPVRGGGDRPAGAVRRRGAVAGGRRGRGACAAVHAGRWCRRGSADRCLGPDALSGTAHAPAGGPTGPGRPAAGTRPAVEGWPSG